MKEREHIHLPPHLPRNIIAGVLILMPLFVTWIAFEVLFEGLARFGRPWVAMAHRALYSSSHELAELVFNL
jgi:uncharacterized membrane protein